MNRKMLLGDPPPIQITPYDVKRLEALLVRLKDHSSSSKAAFLKSEIERAVRVDGMNGRPFVRLGTRLTFADEHGYRNTGTLILRTGTLVLPEQRTDHADGISVLSPDGTALLGLAEGQSIRYLGGDGRTRTLTVLRIHPT